MRLASCLQRRFREPAWAPYERLSERFYQLVICVGCLRKEPAAATPPHGARCHRAEKVQERSPVLRFSL
jgi:hypothetical protein